MQTISLKFAVLLVAFLILPSCGGGGGGDDDFLREIGIDPITDEPLDLEPDTGNPSDDRFVSDYTPSWFTCANDRISESPYGIGACFEYLSATESNRQRIVQGCQAGPGRFLGDGQLCYAIYGRPAFGGTSPGCLRITASGNEIRYELYDQNSRRPTQEELARGCSARGGRICVPPHC